MDRAEIDKDGMGLLFYGQGMVLGCTSVSGQTNVFLLEVQIFLERMEQKTPRPGQFYLIRSTKSRVEFDRPISVYRSTERFDATTGLRQVNIQFLILQKGRGTQELCNMLPGDSIDVIGPLGNAFYRPPAISVEPSEHPEICIVGGGIGIAPVAYFASSLPAKAYDLYASFKSGSYGLEYVQPSHLVVTTDDGSVGIQGMLPAALTVQAVRDAGYKIIYACGPAPMLAYIQQLARDAGIQCYVSMENQMLCGVGACLGCTIPTVNGNVRVCKDGPVFDGNILVFPPAEPRRPALPEGQKPDLSVTIAGVHFQNPVIAASGTFGFGQNYRGFFDVTKIGGMVLKGTTLEPRLGNAGRRIVEVASGNINSIGLQNPGMPHVIQYELPQALSLSPVVTIVNLAGGSIESYIEAARLLDKTEVPMIELNISCPNVSGGGMAWGIHPEDASSVVSAVKAATSKPLMVKLSPNAPDVVAVALACVEAGADALSLINTIQAVSIDIERGKPAFERVRAGLCGPAVKPIALRMVYDVVEALNRLPEQKRVPVVGIGGIACWQDAVEYIMAGAHAVQIGSAKFNNPHVMVQVIEGLVSFMASHGYKDLAQMRGIAQV